MSRSRWLRARTALALALPALLAGPLAGCGDAPVGSGDKRLVVSAAASLTDAFTRIARDFEGAHPGVRVETQFGGSSALATQITSGAPVDVFAAASPATMKPVADAGKAAAQPRVFARNTLQIVVPRGNPGRVRGLADLARDELDVALCVEQVPCGAAARTALSAAGVAARPDTLEQDVRAVLAKVRLGEVDAGLVYRTDARAGGGQVEALDFPEAGRAVNDYPITPVRGSVSAPEAEEFVAWVLGGRGQAVLREAGFDAP